MVLTIDTNILVKAFVNEEPVHRAIVSLLTSGGSSLGHDHEGIIHREYESNVGRRIGFRKWYTRLHQLRAIYFCTYKIPERDRECLVTLGCKGIEDHAFIGVAFNSDRILISEDSDVGKGPKGHEPPHCDILKYLTTKMGLKVFDADEALQSLCVPQNQVMS